MQQVIEQKPTTFVDRRKLMMTVEPMAWNVGNSTIRVTRIGRKQLNWPRPSTNTSCDTAAVSSRLKNFMT